MNHGVPQRSWEKVAVDLYTGPKRLLGYYSGYWELNRLRSTEAGGVIKKLKANFRRLGSLCQFVSDNGPQLVAAEFQKLIRDWDIKHLPTYLQNSKANGKVEAAVKSAKRLLRKTAKGGLGFLAERNIPSQGFGSSPVQRPINGGDEDSSSHNWQYAGAKEPEHKSWEREKLRDVQKKQACSYNTSAHDLPTLEWGDTVRINPFIQEQKEWKKGVVVERLDEGSYKVETTDGSSYRRNTVHFKQTNEPPPKLPFEESPKASSYPGDTGDRVYLQESFDSEEALCIELCKDTVEEDLVGMTRTCSGRIEKRPGHLKGYATWRLATQHWTLRLLLAFEYILLTTWGCFQWT